MQQERNPWIGLLIAILTGYNVNSARRAAENGKVKVDKNDIKEMVYLRIVKGLYYHKIGEMYGIDKKSIFFYIKKYFKRINAMRNKYPGICYRCNTMVEIGKGHFEKIPGTKNGWRVQHANCAIEFRGTDKGNANKNFGGNRNVSK